MTKKSKLLLSSGVLAATASMIPLTIVACGSGETTETESKDMTQEELNPILQVSQQTKNDKSYVMPQMQSNVSVTSNNDAISELAALGISLTLGNMPEGVNAFTIKSYSIAQGDDNKSIKITITGTSGKTTLTTNEATVSGFQTQDQADLADVKKALENLSRELKFKDDDASEAAKNILPSNITTDNLTTYFEAPKTINGVVFSLEIKISDAANDNKGTLIVTVKGSKGTETSTEEFTVTGFQTQAEANPDATAAVNAITELPFKDETAKKVLPSSISTNDLGTYFKVPTTTNGVKFTLKVKDSSANDAAGSLIIVITGSKGDQIATKEITVTGFSSSSNSEGFTYQTLNDTEVKITGFDSSLAKNNLTIPDKVTIGGKEYNVVEIGGRAFESNKFSGSLVIPNSVTSIGNFAFYGNQFSGTLVIPDSVTSIGDGAFSYNHFSGSLTIGNSVTSIGNEAFRGNKFSGSLTIGNSVNSIGYSAFRDNKFSGSLTIGNSVNSIGYSAFRDNQFSGSLTIGNNVTSIGYNAFWNNKFSGSLIIPNSVTSIGDYAFSHNQFDGSLTIIGNNVSIGENAFSDNKFNTN